MNSTFKALLRIVGIASLFSISQFAYADDPNWVQKALKLQRNMDLNAPLNEATFIGTHNSYNSRAYQNAVRYVDPNQNLSLYDQLETGIRSIELDAHWTATKSFSKSILMCHGQSNHLGCSPFDKPMSEGLKEVREWLLENPGEIVLLYIERHLDKHEPRLANELEDILGEFIFKPETLREPSAKRSCVSLPTQLKKADILRANKQLVIVTKGCNPENTKYAEQNQYSENFNDYVFAGIDKLASVPYSFIDSRITGFPDFPDCGKTTTFGADPRHTSLWRIFEDRTSLSGAVRPQRYLLAKDLPMLFRCNINWPTFDMLSKNDERLAAAVWSWAPSYPKDNGGSCAIYENGVGIKNVSCNQVVTGVACQAQTTDKVKAFTAPGVWSDGETACQKIAGPNWHFATPVNGYQMSLLKDSMPAGLSEAWLNYTFDQSTWKVNPPLQ